MATFLLKLGSSAITNGEGFDRDKFQSVMKDVISLHSQGDKILIVSSGAIASGKHFLKDYNKSLIHAQQAASSVGQCILMKEYLDFLSEHKIQCAQVLLTHEDFKRKVSYFNCQKTLDYLLSNRIIPIINENDAISFAEITLGDNDQLAGFISLMMKVDTCIFLTEADGLLDGNNQSIKEISPEENFSFIRYHKKTKSGKGGIQNKLEAIRKITDNGIEVFLGSFTKERPIYRLLEQEGGSRFVPSSKSQISRMQKLRSSVKVGVFVKVDDGAYKALQRNASLLPSGVKQLIGTFHRGDTIAIRHGKTVVGYGVCEYSSKEVKKILGKKSHEIKEILGYHLTDVIIHKDNLVIVK